MATIIALTNQKGGVGKTTTSSALAAGLTREGKKVLGIDLDPQGNFGFSLGLDIEDSKTIYEVFKYQIPIEEAIQPTDYCDLITSNILLSSAALEFNEPGRELMLKRLLMPVEDRYDFIIIDTPPALNILTVNAYAAADYLIIPMVAEILSIVGVAQITETINSVQQSVNPNLHVLGIVLTKFNKRTILAREVKEMAENIAGQIHSSVFETQIRPSVTVAEAPAHGESIYDYSPRSNPSIDYMAFVREVLYKISQQEVLHGTQK